MIEKRRLTYFLSDFHLGARYFDSPLDNERRVVAFLDSIKDSAKEYTSSATSSTIGMNTAMWCREDSHGFSEKSRSFPTSA